MSDKELVDKLEQLAADVREYGFEDARNKWVYGVNVRSPTFDSLIRRPQDYTRLPDTIDINGYKVPEPMRKEPGASQRVFVAWPTGEDYYRTIFWEDSDGKWMMLERGFIHATAEAAAKHGKALASFTLRGE